jgi:predicted enzyme related to lactoylglutathione lyase
LNRIILYAKDVDETVRFYERHFGFVAHREPGDNIVELTGSHGGSIIMIHPAGKGQKQGQVLVKLVFDVEDVEAFCAECAKEGLIFGPLHQADGYVFANAKDPCANSISVSSRAFRKKR